MNNYGWTTIREAVADNWDYDTPIWWSLPGGGISNYTTTLQDIVGRACCVDEWNKGLDTKICRALKPEGPNE